MALPQRDKSHCYRHWRKYCESLVGPMLFLAVKLLSSRQAGDTKVEREPSVCSVAGEWSSREALISSGIMMDETRAICLQRDP